jgi:NADPH:quinone reductase-like Zn-dependent oxidoreductase
VCEVETVPEPGSPGPDEVLLETLAFPINPADLLVIGGKHRMRPTLPAQPGAESVGRTLAAGAEVRGFAPGDLAVPTVRENWVERRVLAASSLLAVDPAADPLQLSMLRGLPGTAWFMLEDYAPRVPGSWVLQTAANSGVGLCLAALARTRGLRSVNIVRRADAGPAILAAGGDVVLTTEPIATLAERILAATGGERPRVAYDAVAGPNTRAIAAALADEAPVVVYGLLSGQPAELTPEQLIFHGLSLVGYGLGTALARRSMQTVRRDYLALSRLVAAGRLHVPIEATYAMDEIGSALAHAAREGRGGKVLVRPKR